MKKDGTDFCSVGKHVFMNIVRMASSIYMSSDKWWSRGSTSDCCVYCKRTVRMTGLRWIYSEMIWSLYWTHFEICVWTNGSLDWRVEAFLFSQNENLLFLFLSGPKSTITVVQTTISQVISDVELGCLSLTKTINWNKAQIKYKYLQFKLNLSKQIIFFCIGN